MIISAKIFLIGVLIFICSFLIAQINGDIKANHKRIGMLAAVGLFLAFVGAAGFIGTAI
jgi:hypothetical protein